MMFFHEFKIDERTRTDSRHAAAIWLGVTQVLLAGVMVYRLYVVGQPDEEIRDFQAVFAIAVFGNIAMQLYFGGVLPVPTWRGALVAWASLAAVITAVCVPIYGWPRVEEWHNTWLPALLGPGILVGAYVLMARMGRQRVERQIGQPGN